MLSLVAAYNFDEGSGSTVSDLSGNGNDGTVSGASWTTGQSASYGNALSFDGVNDWVTVPDAESLDLTTGLTLEAWVYPTSNTGKQDVVIKENSSSFEVYNLYSRNSTSGAGARPEGNVYVNGANRTAVGSSQLSTNTWTHLATTYDGSTLKLYVNGALISSTSQAGTIVTSSGVLRIGGNSQWGEYFQGRIDEVRVYNNALTAADIGYDKSHPFSNPQTVALTFDSQPAGLQLTVNGKTSTTPFSRTVIRGTSVTAASAAVQSLQGATYSFSGWTENKTGGGTQVTSVTPYNDPGTNADESLTLNFVAGSQPWTRTATFSRLPGPVAAYNFDEGSGSTLNDRTGNGNTGTISGATWTSSGKYGNALTFDGVNDWVTVNDANSLDLTNGLTLEAWVYQTSNTGKQDVVIKENSSSFEVYNLYSRNSTSGAGARPEGNVYVNGANRTAVGTSQISTNTWTHLATTFDGTVLRLFVNGTQVASTNQTGSIVTSSGALRIGGNSQWGEYFQGRIDELRIYNRALSATEIQQDKDIPGLPATLVASAASGSQVNLSWTDYAFNESGFALQRSTSSDFSANLVTLTAPSANATSATDTSSLTPGTTYYYRLRSTISSTSANSDWVTTSIVFSAPATPASLTASAYSAGQINLTWKKSSNATGYAIDFADNGSFTGATTITISGGSVNKRTVSGLAAGTTYYFRIRSTNAVGSSSNSSTQTRATLKKQSSRENRTLSLIKDIQAAPSSNPHDLTVVGGIAFFVATTNANGTELWKTDGTTGGTSLVKDINSGATSSSPANLIDVSGTLFFTADDGTNGIELWKSDGTSGGTVMVKDIRSGADSNPTNLTKIGSALFFAANDGTNGVELWKSDGTSGGTAMVKNIRASGNSSNPSHLVDVGDTAYFAADDGTNGVEIWKSDGTSGGTVLVQDIKTGSSSSSPHNLVAFSSGVYFAADDGTHGVELWKADSTGSSLVKDILAGADSIQGSEPEDLVVVNNKLFFTAGEAYYPTEGNDREVWISDGTGGGTREFVDPFDVNHPYSSSPDYLTAVNGKLYWSAGRDDFTDLAEIYSTDGSISGSSPYNGIYTFTDLDLPIVTGYANGIHGSYPVNFVHSPNGAGSSDDTVFFLADDNGHGHELWTISYNYVSSNSSAKPRMLKDINPGSADINADPAAPKSMVMLGDNLIFVADDGKTGVELWISDGTGGGTTLLKDVNSGSNPGSLPNSMSTAEIDGTLYFTADDGINGLEIWKSDGTREGTSLVKDICAGSGGSRPGHLVNVDGVLFFSADDGTNGLELWKSDGTSGGTVMVKNIVAGGDSSPYDLTNIDGTLFFAAEDGSNGYELWKSDGTSGGTVMVKDILSGSGSSLPDQLIEFNGMAFFTANNGSGYELWKSDGTSGGTQVVKAIGAGVGGAEPAYLTVMGSSLYFGVWNGAIADKLWKTDGTFAGTVALKQFSGIPTYLTNVNGTLYFGANDGTNGVELWKSDGTTVGTLLVKNINSGSNSSSPAYLRNVDGTLLFWANDGSNGAELWRSDGTSGGTTLVKDINAGSGNSYIWEPVVLNGELYFSGYDGSQSEVWKSDGTTSGTQQLTDIKPGSSNSSYPYCMAPVGNRLFVAADDGLHGTELWLASGFNSASSSDSGDGFDIQGFYTPDGADGDSADDFYTLTRTGDTWANATAGVSIALTFTDDDSTRMQTAVVTNSGSLTIKQILFVLPQIEAYANADYRTLSSRRGGFEMAWPTESAQVGRTVTSTGISFGTLNGKTYQESGTWMGGGDNAYSPLAAFFDSATTEGVGLAAFNERLDPMKIFWTLEDDKVVPYVTVELNAANTGSMTYSFAQILSSDIKETIGQYYRENFLAPFMDGLGIAEATYQQTGVWGQLTDSDGDPHDWWVNHGEDVAAFMADTLGLEDFGLVHWSLARSSYYEPYDLAIDWRDDIEGALAADEVAVLGTLINPFIDYTYDASGNVVSMNNEIDLTDPAVQLELANERDHQIANGASFTFWDTGHAPWDGQSAMSWLNILNTWKQAGMTIAPEQSNDVAIWTTGAHMNAYHYFEVDLSIANVVTPNATQFIVSDSQYEDAMLGDDDELTRWWYDAVNKGMVPILHLGQLAQYTPPAP